MNENDQSPVTVEESQVTADLHEARGWLNSAADAVSRGESAMSIAEYAQTCAQIGAGYVGLAMLEHQLAQPSAVELADVEPSPEFVESLLRARRSLAEARPHDGEPSACERVPCGNPNADCGRLGGSAGCGGCRG